MNNKFNKLYNLILESVISQNKEFRKNVLAKAGCHQDFIDHTLFRLKIYDNKTGDLLAKFIANDKDWVWSAPPDKRLDIVARILKLNPSIDIQKQNGTMDQFIKKYQESLDKDNAKKNAKTISQLDKIPQFSQKTEYPKNVVIYKVDESKQGMNAVRKIVDLQWGKEASPWCLITRDLDGGMKRAWGFWCSYSEYPKHIAFQNGKLLAFCANDDKLIRWWDRQDRSTAKLKLEDGSTIKVNYKWSDKQLNQKFIIQNGLIYNSKTKLYDSEGNVVVTDKDLIGGFFPVKFGVIKGRFNCDDCEDLKSLDGVPVEVFGSFDMANCISITSLTGLEKIKIHGNFSCSCCHKLKNLKGAPTNIGGEFYASRCQNLQSLEGAPRRVKSFYCVDNDKLTSLKGAPQYVMYTFSCSECYNLTSLQGGPIKVGGDYDCDSSGIKTLKGAPKKVGKDFDCRDTELTSLQGAPEYVGGDFICGNNDHLISLKGAPKYIGHNLVAEWCDNLKTLEGIQNSEIKGHVNRFGCANVRVAKALRKIHKIVDDPQEDFEDQYYDDEED